MDSAIKCQKKNKTPGVVDTSAVLIKSGGPFAMKAIYDLVLSIWNHEQIPQKWSKHVIHIIYKNYYLYTSYKIFTKILEGKIRLYVDKVIGEYQGFFGPVDWQLISYLPSRECS